MAKRSTKQGKPKRPSADPSRRARRQGTGESQTADAATVAWTMAVVTVLLCDVSAVGGHALSVGWPDARGASMFRGLMLFAGAVAGVASLALLPLVYRFRRVPPPTGLVVFGLCAAVAPIIALTLQALR